MPDTDKVESKPEEAGELSLEEARREGLRAAPLSQTQHLDTTEGGIVDLHQISPVFAEAREAALRRVEEAEAEEEKPATVTAKAPAKTTTATASKTASK